MGDSLKDTGLQQTEIARLTSDAFRNESRPQSQPDWSEYIAGGAIVGTAALAAGTIYVLSRGKGGAAAGAVAERVLGKSANTILAEGAEALGTEAKPIEAIKSALTKDVPKEVAALATEVRQPVASAAWTETVTRSAPNPAAAMRAENISGPAIITRSKTADEFTPLLPNMPAFRIPHVYPNAPEFAGHESEFAKTMADVFNQNHDKVVRIEVMGRNGHGTISSGILLPSGHIGTAFHVVDEADGLSRPILGRFAWSKADIPLYPDMKMSSEIAAKRQNLDFSVLELGIKPPELSRIRPHIIRPADEPLRAGERVFGVGYPNDHGGMVVSPGMMLGQRMMRLPAETGNEFLMDEAHMFLNRGNSGGTWYDAEGRLAGMALQKLHISSELPNERGYSVAIHHMMNTIEH